MKSPDSGSATHIPVRLKEYLRDRVIEASHLSTWSSADDIRKAFDSSKAYLHPESIRDLQKLGFVDEHGDLTDRGTEFLYDLSRSA